MSDVTTCVLARLTEMERCVDEQKALIRELRAMLLAQPLSVVVKDRAWGDLRLLQGDDRA